MQEVGRTSGSRFEVVRSGSPGGAVCLELMPLVEGRARAFVRCSPRNPSLGDENGRGLSDALLGTGYSRLLLQDTGRKLLRRTLSPHGWKVEKAIEPRMERKYTVVATSDLPLDEDLIDQDGNPVELAETGHMIGLCSEHDGRSTWAFYTDEGETARVMTSAPRKTGMIVATDPESIGPATNQLVRFLAIAKKSWAVFSRDMEEHISHHHPTPAFRMELEPPERQEHSVPCLSKANRKQAVALFSEYYDESTLAAGTRVRRLRRDPAYSVFLTESGFVIVRFEKDAGLLYDIYVTPSQQGNGIGDELMRCAIDAASERVNTMYLHTSFPRARRLYEKYGFRETSSHLVLRLDEVALTPPPRSPST